MPLYDYQCKTCEHIEKDVLISSFTKEDEEKPQQCSQCLGEDIERFMGVPSLHFKGTGFYCTDYKNT